MARQVRVDVVATNHAGEASEPSIAVLVDEEQEEREFWQDRHVVEVVGPQTVQLSFEPEPHSEHVYWNGLYQPASEWARDGQTLTLPDPDGLLEVGDEIVVEYAYFMGTDPLEVDLLDVPQGHVWKYATGLPNDPATYAAPTFDDSAWAEGPSGYGWGYGFGVATTTPSPLNVWTRIRGTTSGGALTFSMPLGVDNDTWVFLDGVEVWHATYAAWSSGERSVTVPCSAGEHVIATHGRGDGNQGDMTMTTVQEAAV